MKPDHKLLLELVRLGLGGKAESGFSDAGTDWNSLLETAIDQGVSTIAVDGLQALAQNGISTKLDLPENDDLRYAWFGELIGCEADAGDYLAKLSALMKYLQKHDSGRILIMKGYSVSLYYPNPSHRFFGDIDLYSIDGKTSTIDEALHARGGGRHSHSKFRGISVENHSRFTNTSGRHSGTAEIEKVLSYEAEHNSRQVTLNGITLYVPSPDFNALFLISHMANHFLLENIILRQICDWALFLKAESDSVNWDKVTALWKKAGLDNIAGLIDSVAVNHLGLDAGLVPPFNVKEEDEERFLTFILDNEPLKTSGPDAVLKYWKRRWNYRIASDRCWLSALLDSMKEHLFPTS